MKKLVQILTMLFISISFSGTYAQSRVKCCEPQGFTVFYNPENNKETVGLKDGNEEYSDWHTTFPVNNVYTIHAALANCVKTEILCKQ